MYLNIGVHVHEEELHKTVRAAWIEDGIDSAHFPALRAFLAALKEAPPSEDGVERNFSHMPKMCAGPG